MNQEQDLLGAFLALFCIFSPFYPVIWWLLFVPRNKDE
jgi:hypothetical protein